MSSCVEKLSEKFLRFGAVGRVRFFGGGKCANVEYSPVVFDTGGKTLPALPDPLVTGSVLGRSSHIPVILACGRLTKIGNSVVEPITVDVVDLVGKIAMHPQPNKSVSQFPLPIDADLTVPIISDATFHNTNRRAGDTDKANELTRYRVVVKQLSDFFKGNFVDLKFFHGPSFQA